VTSTPPLRPELRSAIAAAQDKKAAGVTLLDLTGLGAFTEAFLLCTGFSTPQLRAISDAIEEALEAHGLRPAHREGRSGAEWLLLDYGSFIVHIFTEQLRQYYDLERLWRAARRTDFSTPSRGSAVAGGESA
jgi:ribosome-associated protein